MPKAIITPSTPFSVKEFAVNSPVWNLGRGWQSLAEPGRKDEPVSQARRLERCGEQERDKRGKAKAGKGPSWKQDRAQDATEVGKSTIDQGTRKVKDRAPFSGALALSSLEEYRGNRVSVMESSPAISKLSGFHPRTIN